MNGEVFIVAIIFGSLTYATYKLFELFVCRKERLALIEKLGSMSIANLPDLKIDLSIFKSPTFTALKAGCLLLGLGVGILTGFFICSHFVNGYAAGDLNYIHRSQVVIIYTSCALLFGGLGLLIAFLVELNISKKK